MFEFPIFKNFFLPINIQIIIISNLCYYMVFDEILTIFSRRKTSRSFEVRENFENLNALEKPNNFRESESFRKFEQLCDNPNIFQKTRIRTPPDTKKVNLTRPKFLIFCTQTEIFLQNFVFSLKTQLMNINI